MKTLNIISILLLSTFINRDLAQPTQSINKFDKLSTTEIPIDPSQYNGNLDHATIRKIQKCDSDLDTMELCMRCAKVTKSEIVYPLCCDNEDGVKSWCHDYIYFGVRN